LRKNFPPVSAWWHLEAVVLRESGELHIPTRLLHRRCGFLVVNITKTLEEQEREDELLVITGVDMAAQERGRAPEVGLKLLSGGAAAHV
jgi:hypothetical protein